MKLFESLFGMKCAECKQRIDAKNFPALGPGWLCRTCYTKLEEGRKRNDEEHHRKEKHVADLREEGLRRPRSESERRTTIGDFNIAYGREARTEAQRQRISSYRFSHADFEHLLESTPVTLIKSASGTHCDVTVDFSIYCRNCSRQTTYSAKARIPMARHEANWILPCGCAIGLQMVSSAEGSGTFFLADKKFDLLVQDIHRGHSSQSLSKGSHTATQARPNQPKPFFTYGNETGGLRFLSQSGNILWGAWKDGFILEWDAETGSELRRYEGHRDSLNCISIAPNGRHFASCSNDGAILVWKVGSNEVVHHLSAAKRRRSLAFAPDGRFLIAGGDNDTTLRKWAIETGAEVDPLRLANEQSTWSLSFAREGDRFLTCAVGPGGKPFASVCDFTTGKEIRRFNSGISTDRCRGLLSPDGNTVLFVSDHELTIHLWDIESGSELQQFLGHKEHQLIGKSISCLALSSDGRRMISGAWDQTVRLWDVASGRQLECFEGHKSGINDLAISPDDRVAVSGGAAPDTSVYKWKLPD